MDSFALSTNGVSYVEDPACRTREPSILRKRYGIVYIVRVGRVWKTRGEPRGHGLPRTKTNNS
jgi:hypothetical protein